jgi:hypothetical protein
MKGSPDVETMAPTTLAFYARARGWTLARAHAAPGTRSPSPPTWATRSVRAVDHRLLRALRRPERARPPGVRQGDPVRAPAGPRRPLGRVLDTGGMDLGVMPPVAPILAKPVGGLPDGAFSFEPKWDGFRTIVFRDGEEVELGSRRERPMTRYFPEVVEAVRAELVVERLQVGAACLLQPLPRAARKASAWRMLAGTRPACAQSSSPLPGAAGTSGGARSPGWVGPCPESSAVISCSSVMRCADAAPTTKMTSVCAGHGVVGACRDLNLGPHPDPKIHDEQVGGSTGAAQRSRVQAAGVAPTQAAGWRVTL